MSMLPLTILIVDDEPLARHWLRMQLGKLSQTVEVFEAASAALAKQWLNKNHCDVILLDIHMPEINGLEFAKQLKIKYEGSPLTIIFVTADSGYALEAFDLAALDYLTKPVSIERLEQALTRVREKITLLEAAQNISNQNIPHITVESHQQIKRIPLTDILYFQAESKYTKIVTKERSYLSEESLNAFEEQFNNYVIRTHRSHLILKHAIEKLVRGQDKEQAHDAWFVKIRGSEDLAPISRRQLAPVKELLLQK